ncbi:MAG TPA: glycosyltransferase family 1 protein [Longimicrobium sp.]
MVRTVAEIDFDDVVAETRPRLAGVLPRKPRRVGILADYLEEGWPSMDLAAELTMLAIERYGGDAFDAALLRPKLPRVLHGRFGHAGTKRPSADRYLGRYIMYPRWLKPRVRGFRLFHVIDHSYAHLVHHLEHRPAVVTCHDLDAFRSLVGADREKRPWWFRSTMKRVMMGLRAANYVICDTHAVRAQLLEHGLVYADRTTVIPLPVHPDFTAEPDRAADAEAARLLGPADGRSIDLLHVGINVPRKRVGFVLRVYAALRERYPAARLVRIGGPLTDEQRRIRAELEIPAECVVELPFLERPVLAAVYRRASALLATSKREGFGWPVVEAMACGTPVVATDLPVFREVGGEAVTYAPVRDVRGWVEAVDRVLFDRRDRRQWAGRREAALERADAFSLESYARGLLSVYRHVLGMGEE